MELAFACTVCSADFRTAGELAEHVKHVHDPKAREDALSRAHRKMAAEPALEDLELASRELPHLDTRGIRERDARLARLRERAAAAIAAKRRGALVEIKAELEAVSTWSELAADYHRERGRVAQESAELCQWVLDVLPEPL